MVEGWKIEVLTNTTLSNLNEGIDTTGAYIIQIRNTNKTKRITDMVLEAECLAVFEGINEVIHLREII